MLNRIKNLIYKLLKKSEKYFKTDMIYLAKGGFWLTFGYVASSISAFLLAITFANLLSRETYGIYKYVLSIAGLLSITTLSGISTSITQAVARGYEKSLVPSIRTRIKWGLIGSIMGLGIAIYYYFQKNTVLTMSFLIISIFIPFMDSFAMYISYLNGKKEFKTGSKYAIITNIISTIVIIGTTFLTHNILIIILSYFCSYTLLRFIFLKITLLKNKPNNNEDLKTISYGKHLSLMNILNTISSYIDKLLLFHFFGASELAIYSIAIAPPEQLKGSIKIINVLAFPKFSINTIENIKKGLNSKLFKITLILMLMSVFYATLAPFIYKILFSGYMESIFYSQIFSISITLAGPLMIFLNILQAKQKTKILYEYNIISPIFRILITIIFIYYLNILGAIIAKILSPIFDLLFLNQRSKH
ncbi:MAG: oligosaccharide flippase family protein [Patescibacteria group bacterium]|nr:oligosaccharide flippase family protein [Patescibacteria group bacterium]